MSNHTIDYVWRDYDPRTMQYVENWLDEETVKTTGLDEGFRVFYEYWVNEDGFVIPKSEAVIFPHNIASQKAFENAGYQHHHTYEDGTAMYYVYESGSE